MSLNDNVSDGYNASSSHELVMCSIYSLKRHHSTSFLASFSEEREDAYEKKVKLVAKAIIHVAVICANWVVYQLIYIRADC